MKKRVKRVEEIVNKIHSMRSWELKESLLRNWAEEIIDECADYMWDNYSADISEMPNEIKKLL